MKSTMYLGIAAVALTALTGCAGTHVSIGASIPGPVIVHRPPVIVTSPPVVVSDPVVIVDEDDIDYWYDGGRYYYLEPSSGLYFYWSNSVRVYCNRGWRPDYGWHRHDNYWRSRDNYWRSRPPVYRPPVYRGPVQQPPHRGPVNPGRPDWNRGGHDNDHRGGHDHRGNDRGGNDHRGGSRR